MSRSCLRRLTCESTGTVGQDDGWARMEWRPKRQHAPLLPVERMVRPHRTYGTRVFPCLYGGGLYVAVQKQALPVLKRYR